MKRLIFITLLIALSSNLFAQRERFRNDLYLGFGGGMHFSTVDFVPSILQTQRLGIQGGIAATFISTEFERGVTRAGIIGELNFSQRGWIVEFDPEDAYFEGFAFNRTLNYIDLPFMTHFNVGRGNVRWIISAGPQIGLSLGGSSSVSQALADYMAENAAVTDRRTFAYRIRYQYSSSLTRVDYGIVGGTGLQFRTAVGHFNLEGRYYFGLGDIFENRRSRDMLFSRSAHRVIQVRLTYYMRMN